jgi:hypothetical protein
MIEVAEAISTFGFGLSKDQVQPADQLVLTRGQLQEIIRAAIQEAIAPLLEKIETLEALQELYHGPAPASKEYPLIRDALNRQRDVQASLPLRVDELEDKVEAGTPQVSTPPARGSKTAHRIDRLKQLLKSRGGSSTFAQIQYDLDLSPSQLSKLVSRLDKRIFEVWRRAGGKHGGKVLGLRARLFD